MEISLSKLPLNETGIIKKLNVNETIKRRLLDLGMINGTNVKALYKSPLKDPTAYLIRGSIIAIRNEDANNILVNYKEKGSESKWD